MLIAIAGHQRSGTSLLRSICTQHPEMAVTMEYACLMHLDLPILQHARRVLSRAMQTRVPFDLSYARKRLARLRNTLFALRYLAGLRLPPSRRVSVVAIESAYRRLYPTAKVVGDKWPDYVFQLERLTNQEGLRCIVIYRDCRDVVGSTLRMVRSNWKGQPWTEWMDTPEKVAQRWVRAIRIMKHNWERVYPIRYEQLIEAPGDTLARLGMWLGVDPQAFPTSGVSPSHVGTYSQDLSPAALEQVLRVASPVMEELGYQP